MKVSELKGRELDLWVARALGLHLIPTNVGWLVDPGDKNLCALFNYSTDWRCGGPVMEQELIECDFDGAEGFRWWASTPRVEFDILIHGETILEAAMRCLVEMKFGEEVDSVFITKVGEEVDSVFITKVESYIARANEFSYEVETVPAASQIVCGGNRDG